MHEQTISTVDVIATIDKLTRGRGCTVELASEAAAELKAAVRGLEVVTLTQLLATTLALGVAAGVYGRRPRALPERQCNGGPHAARWCGLPASLVAQAADGLEWFCCPAHTEGQPVVALLAFLGSLYQLDDSRPSGCTACGARAVYVRGGLVHCDACGAVPR